jgi:hypothetical protein
MKRIKKRSITADLEERMWNMFNEFNAAMILGQNNKVYARPFIREYNKLIKGIDDSTVLLISPQGLNMYTAYKKLYETFK